MIDAIRQAGGRMVRRDMLLVTMMQRHGLRVSEATSIRWDDIDLDAATMHVSRLKQGTPSTHPLDGEDEMRPLRIWKREQGGGAFVFSSLRNAPMSARAARHVIAEAGKAAGIPAHLCHPHALRHSCGYHLANLGRDTRSIQGFLGHVNISHTSLYTALSPQRFKNFWG
jgi:type 1 fimbriae regulatory protein FimB